MSNEPASGLRDKSVGLRGDWIASITNVAPTAATTLTMAALIGASGLASNSLQKTIVYIDSTGGLLFAGYYVVISLYSIWYYRTVLFRDLREFVLGLLLPLVGAGTLVYVIIKSLPGTPVPVRIIALVLFLVGIPLAFLSKAITRAPFFATRRESYREERSEPARA